MCITKAGTKIFWPKAILIVAWGNRSPRLRSFLNHRPVWIDRKPGAVYFVLQSHVCRGSVRTRHSPGVSVKCNCTKLWRRSPEIRSQIARTETFRGYRSVTVAFSGVVGIGAGVVQAIHIPHPEQQVSAYFTLWISAAVLSVLVVGMELAYRLLSCGLAANGPADAARRGAVRAFARRRCSADRGFDVRDRRRKLQRTCGCCRGCGRCCSASACLLRADCCLSRRFGSACFICSQAVSAWDWGEANMRFRLG